MNDYTADLGALSRAAASNSLQYGATKKGGSTSLDMTDFLQLIVAQFQNQDPENAASSTDMLNQLVQMATVQAISTITDATTLMYSSSLVGKTVTVGEYKDGKLQEIVGTVTGTGTYNGESIIFVDGVAYSLNSIMAVGKLPEKPVDPKPPEEGGGEGGGTEGEEKPGPVT